MGDLTLAEVGRTLARIEASQAETAKQVADLAKSVHVAFHGTPDQSSDHPTGILPRLLEVERYYREAKNQRVGTWERVQAAVIAGLVSLVIHAINNWDVLKGGNH